MPFGTVAATRVSKAGDYISLGRGWLVGLGGSFNPVRGNFFGMDISPRLMVSLALLALAPVAAFALLKPASIVWLSAGCVLLITGSLYVSFGPVEDVSDVVTP